MLRWLTDRGGRLVPALLLLALVGCASTDTSSQATSRPGKTSDTPRESDRARESARARESTRAHEGTSRVEIDGAFGFTVTEVVRIGSDVRNDYQRATILLQQDRIEEGISVLETVVERAPDVTVPHIDLGVAYERVGKFEQAEESLAKALSLAPNHPVALNEMGILYRKTGRFGAAREHYQRALAVYPDYHFALRNLGVLCDLYLEDFPCALESYEHYAEIVTEDPDVAIWIADLKNRMGLIEQE
ncbi:MAG: tetratricopeptide repeat protein [Gammaproteobacteria bacterium]|jgi:Flp pilus assembly protein TadD